LQQRDRQLLRLHRPAAIDPATGKPYGLHFPVVTIGDMVRAQVKLIDHLGIDKLLCVAGGSMGGMQVLEWAAHHPQRVHAAIPIATTAHHSPMLIAFSEVGRQAIYADPAWNNGDYYDKRPSPDAGLAVARMVGHITYLSEESMHLKFGDGSRGGSATATSSRPSSRSRAISSTTATNSPSASTPTAISTSPRRWITST
jgi:homoserine O-acetyltransferase